MICPKCKSEYREGITKCSECGVSLVDAPKPGNPAYSINDKGISLIKYAISLLFLIFTQIILVIISYEFYLAYKLTHGGISGTLIQNIHPLIWVMISTEVLISVIILVCGFRSKDKQ